MVGKCSSRREESRGNSILARSLVGLMQFLPAASDPRLIPRPACHLRLGAIARASRAERRRECQSVRVCVRLCTGQPCGAGNESKPWGWDEITALLGGRKATDPFVQLLSVLTNRSKRACSTLSLKCL